MSLIPEDNTHAHINLMFSLRGFSICCLHKTNSNFSVCCLLLSVTFSTRECGVGPVPPTYLKTFSFQIVVMFLLGHR